MDIDNFLNETLIDFFCNMCEIEGLSENEINEKLMGVDGLEASDVEVLETNLDEIDDEMIHDETYWYVKEECEERGISIDRLVSYLTSKYFVYNYDNKNTRKKRIIEYIKKTPLEKIIKRFLEDDEFGRGTIEAYIHSVTDAQDFSKKREQIFKNNDQDVLIGLEAVSCGFDFITLNQLLKGVICNLYNHYISGGCSDIDALDCTWQFFLKNFDPLGELDKMGFDQNTKFGLKQYMLCLMYADLYEDACNNSIIQSDNYDDRLANVIPLVMTQLGMITIPKEEGIRNRILKHFILLQDEKDKMCSNRRKTYEDGRINVLKKFNPTYILDEMSYNK